jgi:toxin HigB-1
MYQCYGATRMIYRIESKTLDRIDTDREFNGGFSRDIVKAIRKRFQQVRAAEDENVLRSQVSLHFEKLKGNRKHQYSIRLNKQFRLIFELKEENSSKTLVVKSVEDYH